MSGETGSCVEPAGADREVDGIRRNGREYSMRTVLCSTTGARRALLLALVAGTAGVVALPATSADAASASGGKHASRGSHTRTATGAGVGADLGGGGAVLGPAVKYVRAADGSIRQVR